MPVTTAQRTLRSIWVELTGKCQLECVHCYAGSSPEGDHGDMTAEHWEKTLDDAYALGARFVCFIGGEPTLNPDLPRLVRHALALGMEVEVFSNLVAVSAATWELLRTPGVRLATSWYTDDRKQHNEIAQRDTWRQTKANIAKAVMYGIPLRAGVIDGLVPGQRYKEGVALLREMGVTDIGGDHLREFGRGTTCDPTQGCGNCGAGRAAILPDGSVTPCPLTRWMKAGNVHEAPLGEHIDEVRSQASVIPNWRGHAEQGHCFPEPCEPWNTGCLPKCEPHKGETADCMPICTPYCAPTTCKPARSDVIETADAKPELCWPDRKPCNPRPPVDEVSPGCFPDACGPDIPCKPSVLSSCDPDIGDCAPEQPCNPDDMGPRTIAAAGEINACQPGDPCGPNCRPWRAEEGGCRPDGCGPVCTPNVPDARDICAPDFIGVCAPHCTPNKALSEDAICKPNLACGPAYACAPKDAMSVCPPDACYPDTHEDCSPYDCGPVKPGTAELTGATCNPVPCNPTLFRCHPDGGDLTACSPCGPDAENCRPADEWCRPSDRAQTITDGACRPDHVCGPAYCVPGNALEVPDVCRPDNGTLCYPTKCGPDRAIEVLDDDDAPTTACRPCGPYNGCGPYACGPYQSCRPDWGSAETAEVTDACRPEGPCTPEIVCHPDRAEALVLAGPDPDPEPEPETTCKPDFICGPALVCGPRGMR
jgi:hypothetical protein